MLFRAHTEPKFVEFNSYIRLKNVLNNIHHNAHKLNQKGNQKKKKKNQKQTLIGDVLQSHMFLLEIRIVRFLGRISRFLC